MSDNAARRDREEHDRSHPRNRGVDPISLIAGVLTLLVATYVLADGAAWLTAVDPRWILAGGAVLAGILILGASARRGRS